MKSPWRRKWQPTPGFLAWRTPWTEELAPICSIPPTTWTSSTLSISKIRCALWFWGLHEGVKRGFKCQERKRKL